MHNPDMSMKLEAGRRLAARHSMLPRRCFVVGSPIRRHRPTCLQEPIEMVIRPAFASFCTTSERDTFDAAVVEECSELLNFTAFVAEDQEFGEFDGAGTRRGLGVHESIFGPYATDAALDVCALIPTCP